MEKRPSQSWELGQGQNNLVPKPCMPIPNPSLVEADPFPIELALAALMHEAVKYGTVRDSITEGPFLSGSHRGF